MIFQDFTEPAGRFYNADCFDAMKELPDGCVDMILCDLPYGTTACKWDVVIPFEPLWEQYKRIIKDNGAVVLFGSEPFSSYLRMSNIKNYKYDWVWNKVATSSGVGANKKPLCSHELISIFYSNQPIYNPQKTNGIKWKRAGKMKKSSQVYGEIKNICKPINDISEMKFPKMIIEISNANRLDRQHPTQKPVALFEYLIKTYTNELDLVLDNCAGSGTTAAACKNLNRRWVCIEKNTEYFEKAILRL